MNSFLLITVLFIAISGGVIFLIFTSIISMNSAFGDGLTQEQITASLGNRQADLLIKLIPTVVTTETLGKGQKPVI